MQVSAITSYNYKQTNRQKLSFGSWSRCVGIDKKTIEKAADKVIYRNNTSWFRGGREIAESVDDIVALHKKADHVNMYIYGCSNGSESGSMWMYLVSRYGDKTASKFGPFKAKDIDEYAIQMAKSGEIPINLHEFLRIQKYTGNKFNRFFEGEKFGIPDGYIDEYAQREKLNKIFDVEDGFSVFDSSEGRCIKQKEELTKNIEYSTADILQDYVNIEPEDSVVVAKNFWPYLGIDGIVELGSKLGDRLKKGCTLVLGDYDFAPVEHGRGFINFMRDVLKNNGFSKVNGKSWFVFKKN